jgi:hypothetical protein
MLIYVNNDSSFPPKVIDMRKAFDDVCEAIGQTPLVSLDRITDGVGGFLPNLSI